MDEAILNLTDSHCHLDDSQFAVDREDVIERARNASLKHLLAIGTGDGPPDLESAIRVAERYPFVQATVGVHPNDVAKLEPGTFPHLRDLLRHPKVVALGEVGLDYHWGVPADLQKPAFRRQLAIAAETRVPVIIHTRDAWEDTLAILRSDWHPTGLPCVMHCFTGTAQQAQECIELGFHLAFGGVLTYPKSQAIREAAALVPPDRLLLETDAPYLPPVPYRGKRNEPAHIVHTARMLAEVRNTSPDEIATTTTANFEALFSC